MLDARLVRKPKATVAQPPVAGTHRRRTTLKHLMLTMSWQWSIISKTFTGSTRGLRYINWKVAYIDTEGTFHPERIVPIAERFGMDANVVLDNVWLLIVDSVIALFRVDFSGRGELAERQQKLAQMLSRLTKISEEFNVAVYITNQVIADPGGGACSHHPVDAEERQRQAARLQDL